MYRKYIKRPLDIFYAIMALVVFCWLYLIIAFLVWIKIGRPILFVQERPGKDEKIFKLYKFRTMLDIRDEKEQLLPDSERLTTFGKRLRSWSLDEIPEALNILKGDMSVVGPRPLLVDYLPLYNNEQRKRHNVKPGLTGLAQINGRNAIDWNGRFLCDIQYTVEESFFLDLKIIVSTIKKAIKKENIMFNDTTSIYEALKLQSLGCYKDEI